MRHESTATTHVSVMDENFCGCVRTNSGCFGGNQTKMISSSAKSYTTVNSCGTAANERSMMTCEGNDKSNHCAFLGKICISIGRLGLCDAPLDDTLTTQISQHLLFN